jgi:hypothetical protein
MGYLEVCFCDGKCVADASFVYLAIATGVEPAG